MARASMGQPRGAAGGPPNPNGPKGRRYYQREARKRDAPPGCERAALPEGAMRSPEFREYQRQVCATLNVEMDALWRAMYGAAAKRLGDIKTTATAANVRAENQRRMERYYGVPMPEESSAPHRLRPCEPTTSHAGYLNIAIGAPERIAREARGALCGVEFDTLIGRGLSGALVIPQLARAMGKRWAIVRKPNDGSHSGRRYEGSIGTRYVFVDDLIASGRTLEATLAALRKAYHMDRMVPPECVGVFLYNDGKFYPANSGNCDLLSGTALGEMLERQRAMDLRLGD